MAFAVDDSRIAVDGTAAVVVAVAAASEIRRRPIAAARRPRLLAVSFDAAAVAVVAVVDDDDKLDSGTRSRSTRPHPPPRSRPPLLFSFAQCSGPHAVAVAADDAAHGSQQPLTGVRRLAADFDGCACDD